MAKPAVGNGHDAEVCRLLDLSEGGSEQEVPHQLVVRPPELAAVAQTLLVEHRGAEVALADAPVGPGLSLAFPALQAAPRGGLRGQVGSRSPVAGARGCTALVRVHLAAPAEPVLSVGRELGLDAKDFL